MGKQIQQFLFHLTLVFLKSLFAGFSMLSIIMTWSLNDTVFIGLLFFGVLLLNLEFDCSKLYMGPSPSVLTLYIASNNCPIRIDFSRQISKVKVETKNVGSPSQAE